jgi:hypothetical protein
MGRTREFTCLINDSGGGGQFSARVMVVKKDPAGFSRSHNRPIIADVYIHPVVGGGGPIHDHFILFDLTGHGFFVARNQSRCDFIERDGTLWDLGQDFARMVIAAQGES